MTCIQDGRLIAIKQLEYMENVAEDVEKVLYNHVSSTYKILGDSVGVSGSP